jgi:hypothetical protein
MKQTRYITTTIQAEWEEWINLDIAATYTP